MSILINGMNMPKSCYVCPFIFYERRQPDVWCTAVDDNWLDLRETIYGERHPSCPLVSVPSHGRLIDADALNYTMLYKENWMSGTGIEAPAVWKKDIESAPTIIEAEPYKEKG